MYIAFSAGSPFCAQPYFKDEADNNIPKKSGEELSKLQILNITREPGEDEIAKCWCKK